MENAQAEFVLGCSCFTVEVEAKRHGAGEHTFSQRNIRDRDSRREAVAIAAGKRLAIATQDRQTLLLAFGVDQRILQTIGKTAAGLDELSLQLFDRDIRHLAGRRTDDE